MATKSSDKSKKSNDLIAIKKCDTYIQQDVDRSVETLFDLLGGVERFVEKGNTVLLKPNLLAPGPAEKSRTTHPSVVIAVAKIVRKAGGKVIIGDSPAIGSGAHVAKSNGLLDLCQKEKFTFVPFDEEEQTKYPAGRLVKTFPLVKEVSQADVIINLPKIKTHGLTSMTCCVKNNFGCVAGINKGQYHLKFQDRKDFSRMLLDVYACVAPDLTIVDGIVGMDGKGGPAHGNPVQLGVLLAGTDCVALDIQICRMLGIDPSDIPTNIIASEEGSADFLNSNIDLVGDKVGQLKFSFPRPGSDASRFAPRLLMRFMSARLNASPCILDNCIGCSDCEKICPAKAIEMRPRNDGKPQQKSHIDYKKCIRCYCCHEICRYNAIELRRPLLGRAMSRIARFVNARLLNR